MEFLSEPRPLGQNGLEANLGLFTGSDLKLQLLGALLDAFFELVMGFLQFALSLFALTDLEVKGGVFARKHDGPGGAQERNEGDDAEHNEQPLRGEPAWAPEHADFARRPDQDTERFNFPVAVEFGE